MKGARWFRYIVYTFIVGACISIRLTASPSQEHQQRSQSSISEPSLEKLRTEYRKAAPGRERATALAAWEAAICSKLRTDEAFRTAQGLVLLLKPAQDGATIRCTFTSETGSAIVVASLDATGDQIKSSGVQALGRDSIVRFSGTLRFPFVTSAHFGGLISGYLVRDDSEEATKSGVTNRMLLVPTEWAEEAAVVTGDPDDPLSFIIVDDGLIYMHGSGTVTLGTGQSHSFGIDTRKKLGIKLRD